MATREEILRTSIEALQASSHQLALEEERRAGRTKGKLKATLQDEEAEAEIEKKLTRLDIAASELSKELTQGDVAKGPDVAGQATLDRPSNYVTLNGPRPLTTTTSVLRDEEPIFDPFTGSFAYRETGFEPGPSVQYEGLEKQGKASTLSRSLGDDITRDSEHRERYLHGSTAEERLIKPTSGDAERSWHPEKTTSHDSKPITSDAERTGRYRLGYIASLLESWMPPKIRGFVFQGSSLSRSKQVCGPNSRQQAPMIPNIESPITPSISSTASHIGDRSQHSLASVSTAPSSLSSVRSTRHSLATTRSYPAYQPVGSANAESDDYELPVRDERLKEQMQAEREEVDRQEARAFEQDRMEATRLQQQFDHEEHRERQATLEYVRGLEKAIQLQEEEEMLQAQQQATTDFARDLEQANLEHAMQMDNERMIQEDRELAQQLQMELDNERAFVNPTGAPSVEPQLSDAGNRPYPSDSSLYRPDSNQYDSHIIQDLWKQASRDRAIAQEIYETDRARAAGEEKQHEELIAWQKVSEASDVKNHRMENAAIIAANRNASKETKGIERTKASTRKAQGPRPNLASPQTYAAQAAQTVTAHDVADCGICGDSLPKTQLVKPCEHSYCRKCLAGWFLRALEEKPKKQPRCCRRDLPVNLVAHHFGPAFLEDYRRFELEIATPNPLYCSSRNCSAFVPPSNIHGDIGVCRMCGGRSCRHCRRREHPGKLCAQDQDTQKVEALGKKQGWKHCPNCKHMIERTAGCLHMTCSQCRTEFCWKCLRTRCKGEGACR